VADEGLIRRAAVAPWLAFRLAFSGAVGCGGEAPTVQTANISHAVTPPARPFPEAAEAWGVYRSPRFRMTIPLPETASWKVDDKTHAELVATDASLRSTLTIMTEIEPSLVNHQACEARARTLGLVSDGALQTVEDTLTVGPEAYDTRIRVGVEKGVGPDKRLVGHVFAFGAYVTKCLVFHLATEVSSDEDEETLSQRLAIARVRILGGLKVSELGSVPRGKSPP
jgi:hypothetical protein